MDKVTEECPDDTTPDGMKSGVNNEYNDEKQITAENKGEGVIQRDITNNEKDTIQDTLDKLIEKLTDETSPVEMEEGVNNKDENEKEKTLDNEMKV